MYERFVKRIFDIVLSFVAIIVLSPLILFLTLIGCVKMKGNPFFIQKRVGQHKKVFKLIKFRTMTNERDDKGELLPDDIRLIPYGRFLRSTSLDELPELFNIIKGDMAIVGPRPLLVIYLPWYSTEQSRRHEVRPGLTGYAQINGRNLVGWDERFDMDIEYVEKISFLFDLKIIVLTVRTVLNREGISSATSETMEGFVEYCKKKGRKPNRMDEYE